MIDVDSIKKLSPKPGDIVIVECPDKLSNRQRIEVIKFLTDTFVDLGYQNKILVFTDDIKINILDKEIIKKLLELK